MMAAVKSWYNLIAGGTVSTGTVGGTTSAVTLTCSPTVDARSNGQRFLFKATSDLVASATLSVDGLTALALTIKGVAISTGHVKNGDLIVVSDDGTNYEIISQLRSSQIVNAQTGTTYTVLSSDRGNLVTISNVAAIAITLPQATSSSAFSAGFWTEIENISTSSLATITPTTSTINGASTLIVYPGQRYKITSDGTNYRAIKMGSDLWRYSAKTANYTLLPADVKPPTVFDFTTASATLSTNVASSNFSGGVFIVKNSASTGDVTFDPNSTETIDGSTTLIIHPGQTYLIQSDGSNWKSIGDNVLMKSSAIASKTGSYSATTADRGKSIRFAGLAADATLTLPAAATCGDGFVLYVSNEDTTDTAPFGVIVDPNGAELIDGFSTRKMYTGSRVTLLCDGTGWRTVNGVYRFFSGDQTLATSTVTTFTHGLGVRPRRMWGEYKCTTTDLGYAVGDVVSAAGAIESDGAVVRGVTHTSDSTTLKMITGNSVNPYYPRKDTGALASITAASWRYRVYAED